MDVNTLRTEADRVRRERFIHYGIMGFLLLVMVLQQFNINASRERIVLEPPFRQHPLYTVGWDRLSEEYGQEWALYVASMVGNVNPANVDFVVPAIERVIHPRLWRDMRTKLQAEAETMRDEGYSLSFEPQEVTYSPDSGLATVSGIQTEETLMGESRTGRATFELQIEVNLGMPRITEYRLINGVDDDA